MRKLSLILAALIVPCLAAEAHALELRAKLQVSGGGTYDYFIVGELAGATDGYDNAYDSLYPSGSLSATSIMSYLPHPEWGAVKGEFRADYRAPAREHEWTAEVATNLPAGTELELSLRGDSSVPAGYRLMVRDEATGAEWDLVAGAYRFAVLDGAARQFTVTAENTLLPQPQETLTVNRSGSGSVAAAPGTLEWVGDVGTASYDQGTEVHLTAAAAPGYVFAGWTGCDAAEGTACTVAMSAARTVGAPFEACSYTIAPLSVKAPAKGKRGTIAVTAPAGCSWTAVSAKPWIKVVSGAAGVGSGTVKYTVKANTKGKARAGTIAVAGETFAVKQAR